MRKYMSVVLSAALAVTMAACSSESGSNDKPAAVQEQVDKVNAPPSGGQVGGADTPCKLPVSFDVAKAWKAKAVADSSFRQASVVLACEIDAKPAGHLGFLRVWTNTKSSGTARQALDEFLAADKHVTAAKYEDVSVASVTGTEVDFIRDNPAADEKKRERVLAVVTPRGTAVLVLGGIDTEEHENMLPAYQLAKQTMKVTS